MMMSMVLQILLNTTRVATDDLVCRMFWEGGKSLYLGGLVEDFWAVRVT